MSDPADAALNAIIERANADTRALLGDAVLCAQHGTLKRDTALWLVLSDGRVTCVAYCPECSFGKPEDDGWINHALTYLDMPMPDELRDYLIWRKA